jgi:hypothetical protein
MITDSKNNVLLRIFKDGDWENKFVTNSVRSPLTIKYSWAIPDCESLKIINKYSPLIEHGPGTGYWAMLLRELGCDIKCLDYIDKENERPYFYTKYNNHIRDIKYYRNMKQLYNIFCRKTIINRNLFLCWPTDRKNIAYKVTNMWLKKSSCDYLLYIGEDEGGCTGTKQFHDLLDTAFVLEKKYTIISWVGMCDMLYVYKRKKKNAMAPEYVNG